MEINFGHALKSSSPDPFRNLGAFLAVFGHYDCRQLHCVRWCYAAYIIWENDFTIINSNEKGGKQEMEFNGI